MLDRVIDRLPALLLLAFVALGAHVAIVEARDWRGLSASVPAFLLFVWYLRSGPGTGGAGGKSGVKSSRSEARAPRVSSGGRGARGGRSGRGAP